MFDADKTRPMEDWVLCRALDPQNSFGTSKLIMPKDMDKDVVSEGVAQVLAVGPGSLSKRGKRNTMLVGVGDRVLYRGFLRFAHQVGETFGEDKASKVFFLKVADILAVVEGEGSLGYYGEYVLE